MDRFIPAQGKLMEWGEYVETIARHGREERDRRLKAMGARPTSPQIQTRSSF